MDKGQYTIGYKWIYFLVAIFLLAFMFLFLRTSFDSHQFGKIECADNAIDEIIIAKAMYDETCLVYTENGRPIPGIIDQEKFTDEQLASCFQFITKKVQIQIGETKIGDEIFNVKEIKKPILLYNGEEKEEETMTFRFAEATC